ncbi:hypothetical protein [Nocardioides sp. B-3]|uniref:hypothetical protein n=1 Tax=Nocardioides sp. B-3 TaxID=2895565 RepID=UPI0021523D72|nr:hypothetical protein [Nocardioides sp. B-3]UUZ60678.1 hypothetical protein LP418_07625 [Nocardioides sp. B-3]
MQIGLSLSSRTSLIARGREVGLVGEGHAHVDVEHVRPALDPGLHVALDRGQVARPQLFPGRSGARSG